MEVKRLAIAECDALRSMNPVKIFKVVNERLKNVPPFSKEPLKAEVFV
jgi:hypothetical protein